jgi:hypothetical protein
MAGSPSPRRRLRSSREQLAYAQERNPGLTLYRRDLTKRDGSQGLEQSADLVFTQAVLMHIHGGDRPGQFVRNLAAVSRRHILLVGKLGSASVYTSHPRSGP